jgi:hypothetical protein
VDSVVANVYPRDAFCRTRCRCSEVLNSCSLFVAVEVVFILSPLVRVLRKSTKCVYEGSFLSGKVRCHLRMMLEGNFDVINVMSTTFDVTGSPSFSNA